MKGRELPRLTGVVALQPHVLELEWRGGGRSIVDIAGPVSRYRILKPIVDNPELFAKAHLVGYGSGVGWTEQADISALMLARMAEDQGQFAPDFFDPFRTPELTTP